MKFIITLLVLATTQTVFSAEIGSLEGADFMSLSEERIHNLVASSAEVRKSLQVGRDIAGFSAEDQKWANEFDELMESDKDVDYLKLASEL